MGGDSVACGRVRARQRIVNANIDDEYVCKICTSQTLYRVRRASTCVPHTDVRVCAFIARPLTSMCAKCLFALLSSVRSRLVLPVALTLCVSIVGQSECSTFHHRFVIGLDLCEIRGRQAEYLLLGDVLTREDGALLRQRSLHRCVPVAMRETKNQLVFETRSGVSRTYHDCVTRRGIVVIASQYCSMNGMMSSSLWKRCLIFPFFCVACCRLAMAVTHICDIAANRKVCKRDTH